MTSTALDTAPLLRLVPAPWPRRRSGKADGGAMSCGRRIPSVVRPETLEGRAVPRSAETRRSGGSLKGQREGLVYVQNTFLGGGKKLLLRTNWTSTPRSGPVLFPRLRQVYVCRPPCFGSARFAGSSDTSGQTSRAVVPVRSVPPGQVSVTSWVLALQAAV